MKPKPRPEPLDDLRVMPTPERQQHDRLEYGEVVVFSELGTRGTSKAMATRVTTQRAIDRLRDGGVLDERQHKAACLFWARYHASGMEAGKAVDLNGSGGGGQGGPAFLLSERAAMARQEWNQALATVPRGSRLLFMWVVCDDRPLRQWVARLGMRPGRAVTRAGVELAGALDAVARHWRL